MKKVYAFIATALVATSLFFVQKNGSEYLFDANVEALARIEDPVKTCNNYCYDLWGYVCVVSTNHYDIYCDDMHARGSLLI